MFIDQKLAATSAPEPADTARASFAGSPRDFFRLLVRGSLLQLPTLGFYRFWFLTDIRRHLWSNTRIGEDAFEYTGTGKELLVGFLMAMAVLAPIYVVYFWLGVEAEQAQAFASVPLLLVLYVLGQYARFRARRYRATRTVFRGVRFWMAGSAWGYAGRVILYDLLTVLTLGFAYPWRAAALQRYLMNNTRYGDLAGSFTGTGWTLLKRAGWIWVLALAVVAAAVACSVRVDWQNPSAVEEAAAFAGVKTAGVLAVLGILLLLLRAIEFKWWLQGLRFGPIAVSTGLRTRSVVWRYAKTGLVGLAYALVVSLLAGIAAFGLIALQTGFGNDGASAAGTTAVAGLTLLGYLVALLGFGVIKRLVLDRGLWALAAGSVTLTGVAALDRVRAEGRPAGSFGEGMADALDVGGL